MSQQRKNIFIDGSLWSYQWFDDMLIEYQMAYLILWCESDNIGVWRPHFRELNFKLKQEIDPEAFLQAINSDAKRIEVLDNSDWWLIDYLPLQVRTLTPNNRPHVSYIEDLRSHGLLTRYAKENPENVKFEVIEELEQWEQIKDFDKKKRAKSAWKYLDSKGLIRPLQEAYKTLARGWQDSKEKEEDKEQEEEEKKEQEKDQEQDEYLATNDLKANGKGEIDNPEIFGEVSLNDPELF